MQAKGFVAIGIAVVTLITLLFIPIFSVGSGILSMDMTFFDVLKDFGDTITDAKIFVIFGILGFLALIGAIVTLFIDQEDIFPFVLIAGGTLLVLSWFFMFKSFDFELDVVGFGFYLVFLCGAAGIGTGVVTKVKDL